VVNVGISVGKKVGSVVGYFVFFGVDCCVVIGESVGE